jgi:hypothetical protein
MSSAVPLIGLTASETDEFEELDNSVPLDEHDDLVISVEQAFRTPRELRWLELYQKHTAARLSRCESRLRLLVGAADPARSAYSAQRSANPKPL